MIIIISIITKNSENIRKYKSNNNKIHKENKNYIHNEMDINIKNDENKENDSDHFVFKIQLLKTSIKKNIYSSISSRIFRKFSKRIGLLYERL